VRFPFLHFPKVEGRKAPACAFPAESGFVSGDRGGNGSVIDTAV
jgi:hypothetical protein